MLYEKIPKKYFQKNPIIYSVQFVIFFYKVLEIFLHTLAEDMHEICKNDKILMDCANTIQEYQNEFVEFQELKAMYFYVNQNRDIVYDGDEHSLIQYYKEQARIFIASYNDAYNLIIEFVAKMRDEPEYKKGFIHIVKNSNL